MVDYSFDNAPVNKSIKTPVKEYDQLVKKHKGNKKKVTEEIVQKNPVENYSAIEKKPDPKPTVRDPSVSAQRVDQSSTVMVNGQGYSVAPSLQSEFVRKKRSSDQTIPRTVSPQETQSVPLNVDISKVPINRVKQTSGSFDARRVGDYSTRYDSEGNRLTPSSLDLAESKTVNAVGGSVLNPVGAGVVSGLFSVSKLGYTVLEASNFNSNELNRLATQDKIKKGVFEVVKDPFNKLVADPLLTVAKNPLYEGSKLGTELLILEGGSRVAKSVVKEVAGTNKFSSADVKSSAYDLSRSSEKAQVFLRENEINPSASGGSEFVPLPQLTVDISPFNKNQKYFSSPERDVPVDRQFTIAGTEVKPPLNKKGVLPLDTVSVSPFESNPLTIEQIGKKPLIDATSSAQSRMVDLPVSKSANKPEILGRFVAENPRGDVVSVSGSIGDQSSQVGLEKFGVKNPYERVSSVPKGSSKPFVYDRVKVVEDRPLPDNSHAYVDTGLISETVGSTASTYPARSFGAESRIKVSSDYVYDSGSDSYVKKIGDFELNKDIKGKVTPSDFRIRGGVVQPQTEQPKILPEIRVDPIQSPKGDTMIDPKSDSGQSLFVSPTSDQSVDQVPKSKTRSSSSQIQINEPSQEIAQIQSLDTRQRIEPKLINPSPSAKIKPLLPTLRSDRQVKSGSGMFDVLVRKQGKFVRIGSGYSDLATAFNRGRQEVKNTASASFKVVSRLGEVQRFNLGSDRSLTRSKRDQSVIVQKREYRISSEGEKTEISRKGVFTQKVRKSLMKKGVFG